MLDYIFEFWNWLDILGFYAFFYVRRDAMTKAIANGHSNSVQTPKIGNSTGSVTNSTLTESEV